MILSKEITFDIPEILKKGDIVVCVNKGSREYTYGEKYELYDDTLSVRTSILPIRSDSGKECLPSYYKISLNETNLGHIEGYYFLPLVVWRQLRLNKILSL